MLACQKAKLARLRAKLEEESSAAAQDKAQPKAYLRAEQEATTQSRVGEEDGANFETTQGKMKEIETASIAATILEVKGQPLHS
jgi:hypothetical protein